MPPKIANDYKGEKCSAGQSSMMCPGVLHCSTDTVRAELVTMSPVVAETTLVPKTSRERVTQSREVAVGAGIGGAVLMIVAKKVTTKTLS